MSWMAVWTRAVVVPAMRRARPAWIGAVLVASIVGGGNGLMPRDVTRLALHVPAAGAALVATWILLIVPAARVLVRQDGTGAHYLRALPSPRLWPRLVATVALVAIQLPWLALWLAGEGASGLGVVAAGSVAIAAIAAWPARAPRAAVPRWRTLARGLVGIHARALRRRAGHALVRGAGLAVLAGCTGGLVANNNDAHGAAAGVLAAATIAIVLVPGWAGALVPLVETHRDSAWLATSLGASERGGIAATVIAPDTAIAPIVIATAAGIALVTARGLAWADRVPRFTAVRAIVAAVGASALAVLALAVFGAPGVAALAAVGMIAVLR